MLRRVVTLKFRNSGFGFSPEIMQHFLFQIHLSMNYKVIFIQSPIIKGLLRPIDYF